MNLAWPICHFIGGYGDLLQKVEVLEHPKNEPGLANLSFYRGLRRPIAKSRGARGGYGDRLQKVEVLEHPKNEPGLANLSFYRGLRRPIAKSRGARTPKK